jgi:hypothetical protein
VRNCAIRKPEQGSVGARFKGRLVFEFEGADRWRSVSHLTVGASGGGSAFFASATNHHHVASSFFPCFVSQASTPGPFNSGLSGRPYMWWLGYWTMKCLGLLLNN